MNPLHLLSPPCCVVCQRIGGDLCLEHLNALCWNSQKPIENWIWSAVEYRDSAQDIVKAVKYEFLYSYTVLMAQLIAIRFPHFTLKQTFDCLIPVPLHHRKKAWRGFNQAERLARSLGKIWNVPIVMDALIRTTHSAAQASLNRDQRAAISHSFQIVKSVKGKNICLIDDVVTTGSTLSACCTSLLESGAQSVIALTFAREL